MSKNIIVCCDGTGNEFGPHNTNVVKLYEAIDRNANRSPSYDPGVGTFSVFGRVLGRHVGKLLGQMFGAGLQQNVEDAYRYLMDRYEPGDKLFLFGFSRGAYTVRALAGMLRMCGLLQKGSVNLIPYATRIYNDGARHPVAPDFKRAYCHDCRPHLIGVWDTVGSMGWFWGRKFFDTTLSDNVSNGYHAVSIDERRRKFPVSLWCEARMAGHQNIEQVWFPGVHSDVGGSYNETGLSDLALEWMLKKAEAHGLRLRSNWTRAIKPNPSECMHDSRTGFWRLWRPAPRVIPPGAQVHQSVQARMDDPKLEYNPPNLPEEYQVVGEIDARVDGE